uniref:Gustatory receptor 25 n=1 Tax=Chouioia cunea TaxID=1570515 RepID=A0A6B9CJI6_9HYME|nr:gustatory receptor 25 [Chouioia cunea]
MHCRHHSHSSHTLAHSHKRQIAPTKLRRVSSGMALAQGGDHSESLMWRFDCELAGEPDVIISPAPPPPPPPPPPIARTTTL